MTVPNLVEAARACLRRDRLNDWIALEKALAALPTDACPIVGVPAALLQEVADYIRDTASPDPCRFDHHGGCQEHGYLSLKPGERCPMSEAADLAARLRSVGGV